MRDLLKKFNASHGHEKELMSNMGKDCMGSTLVSNIDTEHQRGMPPDTEEVVAEFQPHTQMINTQTESA